MKTFEASTSICDSNGNLLFYTNGNVVYNKNHDTMQNGKFKARHHSSCQGVLALPMPNNNHLYYILLNTETESTWHTTNVDSLQYIIVDMNLDFGLGGLVTKEIGLLPRSLEFFAIGQHANGKDYWVASRERGTNRFNCTQTVNGIFTNKIIVNTLLSKDSSIDNVTKFSPDSKIVVTNRKYKFDNGIFLLFLDLYKFDNFTGRISDRLTLNAGVDKSGGYLEFSPNSKYVYINTTAKVGSKFKNGIFQYDLTVWDSATINSTMRYLDLGDNFANTSGLQLAPDGKIYVFPSGMMTHRDGNVYYINEPNKPYPNCITIADSINLKTTRNGYGGPYYPGFWFMKPLIKSGRVQYFCSYDSMILRVDISGADSFQWENGNVNDTNLIIYKPGIYRIKTFCSGKSFWDEIVVKGKTKYGYYLNKDSALCSIPMELKCNSAGQIKWSTGETTQSIKVSDTGYYRVHIVEDICVYDEKLHLNACKDMYCYIPDAFSMDNNGLNDSFKITCGYVNKIVMKIYNRWGQEVFYSDGLNKTWDGNYKGKPCTGGVYGYLMEIHGIRNGRAETQFKKGTIHLLK